MGGDDEQRGGVGGRGGERRRDFLRKRKSRGARAVVGGSAEVPRFPGGGGVLGGLGHFQRRAGLGFWGG